MITQTTARKVATYNDFRDLLARSDIDAVLIATPDHWHALQTILACRSGKDVYVEKPTSLRVREGRAMVNSARKHGRIVQVGSQQRSGSHYINAINLIRQGTLGGVHHITANYTRNKVPGFVKKDINLHANKLDWELWLGPAPFVPFEEFRCIYNYRWFWDYSGGQMTNWGSHNLDIARWAIGAKGPIAVSSFGGRYELDDGGETPDLQATIYRFPHCIVTWTGREISAGNDNLLEFHGTKGTMVLTRECFRIIPETSTARIENDPPLDEMHEVGEGDLDCRHIRNFLDCVHSRQRPNSDIEEGHLTAAMCHLGNISLHTGRMLNWNADAEVINGDEEANERLSYSYREPWSLELETTGA
jgi:predicted dehydrogenase